VKLSGGGGRRRLPAAGAITASMVLLATSAASPGEPVNPAKAPDQDRPAVRDQVAPRGARDAWLPGWYEASGTVENADDAGPVIPAVFTGDIPATVLDAYRHARDLINTAQPGCHLPLELLEAIGKAETNHARNGLVDANGTALDPILGPVLDGHGFAAISDTDGGRLDGDPVWDRAVGPTQFLPSTWASWAADGNGDHRADPNNVYDASLATARYLCAANRDLGTPEGLSEAIFSYNHSTSYRNLVLAWMAHYASGTTAVPNATALGGGVAPVQTPATAMPADNARPAPAPTQPATNTPPAPPPTSTPPAPPTSTPPAPPPVTTVPVPPISAPPATQPSPAPASTPPAGPVQGLVCTVTGLVGGLLGSLTGGGQPPNC
jgi:Transglycosylase SLT domain